MQTNTAVMKSLTTVAIIAFTIFTMTGAQKVAEKVSPCCVSVSTSPVPEPIIGFSLQQRNPPCVQAVIFKTEKGHFCTDPRQFWVQKKVKELMKSQKTTVSPNTVTTTPMPTNSVPMNSESPRSVSPRLIFSRTEHSTVSN
ncbi:C-C motif chemokine 24-like [Hoplias malabaricus]|uniref:C-C motif chemokine 24-like n=1 Tax=Hoplias malabaricus TaxID=27720 RepID=UPI00346259CB